MALSTHMENHNKTLPQIGRPALYKYNSVQCPEKIFLLAKFSKVIGYYGIALYKFSIDLSQYFTPIVSPSLCTECGIRSVTRFCRKLSWQFHWLVSWYSFILSFFLCDCDHSCVRLINCDQLNWAGTPATLLPGKKEIARGTFKKINTEPRWLT